MNVNKRSVYLKLKSNISPGHLEENYESLQSWYLVTVLGTPGIKV
jgi:hypothetical protein